MPFGLINFVEAWNAISWADAIPFCLFLYGAYWLKVKIDTNAGMGIKKRNELKRVIVEALQEHYETRTYGEKD